MRVRRWRRSCPYRGRQDPAVSAFLWGDFRFAVRFRPALGRSRCPGGKLLWGRLLHGLFTAFLAVPWLKRVVLPAMTGAAVPAFSWGGCCGAAGDGAAVPAADRPLGAGDGGRGMRLRGGRRRSRPEGAPCGRGLWLAGGGRGEGGPQAGPSGRTAPAAKPVGPGEAGRLRPVARLVLKCAEGQGIVTGK